jgi:photosystem II stability/assembly factor-like uncharacterized protein
MRAALLLFACTLTAHAQWQILDAHTTADLRGIDNVGNGVVWASGTHGTVLRTEDNGTTWQHCTTPPDADKLDFRGIQAFDAKTAIVMSSGKGDLSRLYKTTDGCQTWKLVFTNPDKDGFWDALKFEDKRFGSLLGDPVRDRFVLFNTRDGGNTWQRRGAKGVTATSGAQGAFAASNSSLMVWNGLTHRFFVSGGKDGAFFYSCNGRLEPGADHWDSDCSRTKLPLAGKAEGAGGFSVAAQDGHFITVGGNYGHPNDVAGTAAWSKWGEEWHAATTPPHGYRSAVTYDAATKTWITVGPNGTDISSDDGRNWRALKPGASDAPDTDQHWNALSLPFVVGPKGRIGMLQPGALKGDAK